METTGGAPTQAAAPAVAEGSHEPDFSSMTGEQAKAWVEAQKAQKTQKTIKETPKADPYLADKPKESSKEAVKEAVAEAKRRLKIDDEEVDEEEVIKTYRERKGHQQAANKKLQEGTLLRKQAEEFVGMLKDPEKFWEVARKMGHEPRTMAEKVLVKHLEEEMMTPEQKAQRQRDFELAQFKAEKEARERTEKERDAQILRDRFAQDYTQQFTQALKETNLPPTKQTVAAMARYIGEATKINFKMTAQEAAKLVKEDMMEAQRRLIGETDGEMLIKLLGDDVANKIRKWDTGRLRDPNPPRVSAEDQGKPREKRVVHKRMSAKEWREYNRR
jgi:hypothetical protein